MRALRGVHAAHKARRPPQRKRDQPTTPTGPPDATDVVVVALRWGVVCGLAPTQRSPRATHHANVTAVQLKPRLHSSGAAAHARSPQGVDWLDCNGKCHTDVSPPAGRTIVLFNCIAPRYAAFAARRGRLHSCTRSHPRFRRMLAQRLARCCTWSKFHLLGGDMPQSELAGRSVADQPCSGHPAGARLAHCAAELYNAQ